MHTDDPVDVLECVYVANVTPFRDDERLGIDVDAHLGHVRWLAGRRVTGVIPSGTNGEGHSIAPGEKRALLDALIPEAGALQVVPTVTEGALADTLDLLDHLQGVPVRAVMVHRPTTSSRCRSRGRGGSRERVLAATRS